MLNVANKETANAKQLSRVLVYNWLPAERLSMAPGHLQALGGAGSWGRGERGLSSGADCCSTQPASYWKTKYTQAH